MQNFKKSKNQIPSIEFAINHQNSSNIPSSHFFNLIVPSEHPYWYTTHWLKSQLTWDAPFHSRMPKSASLTQILYWSHVEYSMAPDMLIFGKYTSRAF